MSEKNLQSAIISTLEMANFLKSETIALPGISLGYCGFPKERCAEIMLQNMVKWAAKAPGTLKEVRIVLFD